MNEFFSEDEYTTVKTYLNEWSNMSELISLIEPNNDILFFMDFLKSNDFKFYPSREPTREINSCKFPVVYKPKLVSNTSGTKRSVELSQPRVPVHRTAHLNVVGPHLERLRAPFS